MVKRIWKLCVFKCQDCGMIYLTEKEAKLCEEDHREEEIAMEEYEEDLRQAQEMFEEAEAQLYDTHEDEGENFA